MKRLRTRGAATEFGWYKLANLCKDIEKKLTSSSCQLGGSAR
jgi:hypothetical protein